MALQQFESNIDHFNANNPFHGDENTPVEFYHGTFKNDVRTAEEGRPIYDDVECIRIFNSKNNIIDRPIRDTDKQRWPRQYAAWKSGNQEAGKSGTPLEHWSMVTRAQAEEFKHFKIFTVEQLAEASDSQAINFIGFQKYKNLAKQFIELAKGNAPIVKMQEALDERDATIAAQQDQINKLASRLEVLESKKGR